MLQMLYTSLTTFQFKLYLALNGAKAAASSEIVKVGKLGAFFRIKKGGEDCVPLDFFCGLESLFTSYVRQGWLPVWKMPVIISQNRDVFCWIGLMQRFCDGEEVF